MLCACPLWIVRFHGMLFLMSLTIEADTGEEKDEPVSSK